MSVHFGKKIKEIRKKNNLTQLEFAQIFGYKDKSMIAHIENGETEMNNDKIALLIDRFNVDANELFCVQKHKQDNKDTVNKPFVEIKLFQVKPEKLEQFEAMIKEMSTNQLKCEGCISLNYFKRFYSIDGIELGEPPRKLTKIVKCLKYYSYWEFDTKENYGKAIKFFFENYNRELQKLLIAPFDINLGYSV